MKIETTLMPLVFADPPEGVSRVSHHAAGGRSEGAEALASAVYTISTGVSAGLISAWLYDQIKKFKDKPQFRIRINERDITEFSEEAFKRTVEREIEIDSK